MNKVKELSLFLAVLLIVLLESSAQTASTNPPPLNHFTNAPTRRILPSNPFVHVTGLAALPGTNAACLRLTDEASGQTTWPILHTGESRNGLTVRRIDVLLSFQHVRVVRVGSQKIKVQFPAP